MALLGPFIKPLKAYLLLIHYTINIETKRKPRAFFGVHITSGMAAMA
jgi:hypothetical protein